MTDDEMYEELGESAKEWVVEQTAKINKELFIWLAFLSLAFTTPIILCFFKPATESMGIWIQRSGAIIVVFSLLAEIKSNSIEKMAIIREHTFLYCHMYLKSKYEKKIIFINYFTFFAVALGTVIWGYGDILISYAMN